MHAVRDLDAAVDLYRRMGFTVGARNWHPWGTHNHIIQLPGFFIELLTVAEPQKLGDDDISRLFGKFNQEFIAQGDGLSMLLLESKNAVEDVEAFRDAGIAASDRKSDFEREAKNPAGSPIKVGFSLAFAEDKFARSIHFATCQQHHPANFWNPAFQKHANGVQGVRGVVMVADDPEQHRSFVLSYTGSTDFYLEPGEVSVMTPRGALSIMTPARFAAAFGGPQVAGGSRLQAIRFAVSDIGKAGAFLDAAGITFRNYDEGLVVDEGHSLGACMSFEPIA